MITIRKLWAILDSFILGAAPTGKVYANGNGELCIEFDGQPSNEIHDYLAGRDFFLVDRVYIYRPLKKGKDMKLLMRKTIDVFDDEGCEDDEPPVCVFTLSQNIAGTWFLTIYPADEGAQAVPLSMALARRLSNALGHVTDGA